MKAKEFVKQLEAKNIIDEKEKARLIIVQYLEGVEEKIKQRKIQTYSGTRALMKNEMFFWLLAVKRIGKYYWFRPEGVMELIEKRVQEVEEV